MSDSCKTFSRITIWHAASGLCVLALVSLALPTPVFAQRSAPAKKKVPAKKQRSTQTLDLTRAQTNLPQSQKLVSPETKRSLEAVKPPKSMSFYDTGNSKEAEYERILDEEIKTLYRLSQQQRGSANRGEIWLRLGERYVEKARLIELREQSDYERKLKEFASRKTKIRPQLNTKPQREHNEKAVQLYEWFIKDFPQDPKVDQALFFLGYNHFELGNTQLGERYYSDLVRRFSESVFITESRFALGEYYFENDAWKKALENYAQVIKVKKARLNTFALYKSAWCLYRLNRTKTALQALERVVAQSRANESADSAPGGRKAVNKLRLAQEALRDYVPFYAESGDANVAYEEFRRVSRNEKSAQQMLERLAFIYADNGNRVGANTVFKQLIAMNPTGERAAEYQYQIVLAYATHDQKEFRRELDVWLETFGPASLWSKENTKNDKLVGDMAKLQETTLRNFVLQQHQAAQNSRAPFSQQTASAGYNQYFKHFSTSPKSIEMRFFHAELLFDMGKYEEAARDYSIVAERDPQGPYREKAVVNTLLALERDLPSAKEIDAKRGTSLEKIPFDPPVARFEKAALRYIQTFPKGQKTNDIKRRLGVLYYSYNHFEEAMPLFEQVISESPQSENAEIAGNLILDTYKLKNDMVGLAEKGQALLANPAIASTKFGAQLRLMMEKAGYLKAEKMAAGGDALKAGKEFETFAAANKQGDLNVAARYNAATNYEKGGDLVSAIRNHGFVLAAQASNPKVKAAQNDSRNALARIYQQTGQLELAAKQYVAYAAANPKDAKAVNAYYNAGLLFDGLGETGEAMNAYQAYFDSTNKADRTEVIYNQAEMLRRKGQFGKAIAYYDRYLSAGPRNETHAVHATFLIAQSAERAGQAGKAKQWYQRVLELQKSAKSKQSRDESVKYAAEARFALAQETLQRLLAIRFGTSDKQQARAATDVNILRQKYIGEMKDVIRFDHGPSIVAALASTGRMFDSLSALFGKIPAPAGFQGDEIVKYKELIQVQINGFKLEAKNSYKAATDKAREFESYGLWTKVAQHGLLSHENGVEEVGEILSDARAADWMGL